MYFTSLEISSSWTSTVILRFTSFCFTGGLRTQISFAGLIKELYGHGIQSFLLCVWGIALSVASVPIASHSVASSLYAVLPVILTIVHFEAHPFIPSIIGLLWLCRLGG